MTLDRDRLFREILNAVGEAELARVRPLISSATLRQAIFLAVYASLGEARLIIPHYWAVYYHDGRGSITPTSASKLVFFEDPLRNDPRLSGAYPVRPGDVPRLTRDQYLEGLDINNERRKSGLPPFMFVVDAVGPSRPRPFFDQLANNSANRNSGTVKRIFEQHLFEGIHTDPDTESETDGAEFII